MKILLISANRVTSPYPVYPLGLDYVAGSLSDNHRAEIIDMNQLPDYDKLGDEIEKCSPDLIGISLRNIDNTEFWDTKAFISHYKAVVDMVRKKSDAPIVLGGSGFTIFPHQIMEALGADFGIIGEGEPFGQLADSIEKGGDITIPGVITSNGKTIPLTPWDKDIKCRFNPKSPHISFYLNNGGMLNLQTKRGCPFNCIYCTYPRIEGHGLRRLEADEVAENALQLQKAGAKYFFITDAVFNCDIEHNSAVAEAFIKKGVSIPWGAYFTPQKPAGSYYSLMAKAGLSHIEFGTEALSGRMLEAYNKPFTVDDVFTAHKAASEAGIHIAHFMLLGGPGEERKTVMETVKNADSLEKAVFFFFCGIRIYPHTGLHRIAIDEGVITAEDSLLEPVFYQTRDIDNNTIMEIITSHSGGRSSWVFGSGGEKTERILKIMYKQGLSGPLWEHLIQ